MICNYFTNVFFIFFLTADFKYCRCHCKLHCSEDVDYSVQCWFTLTQCKLSCMCKIMIFFPRNFSFDDAHCEGARVIAQAAREAGVKRLIHVSALNASEESPSTFLQSKVLKEKVICFLFN